MGLEERHLQALSQDAEVMTPEPKFCWNCYSASDGIKLCPKHASVDALRTALSRIAGTLREGEALEGTHEEHCHRSPAAAFTALDSLIVIARDATEAQPDAVQGGEG